MNEQPAVELDYAFPAQWARVNADGSLTAIDASFLKIACPIGQPAAFAVAARLRFKGGMPECELRIEMRPPADGATLSFVAQVSAEAAPVYGDGRRHVLLALNSALFVQQYGHVEIEIYLNDRSVRKLMFEIVEPTTAQG
ncbi:hypothetical protein GCM10027418_22700 [Mariniluteicoccus endophyticus]